MSALTGKVKFINVGDSVAGRIVSHEDYQEKEFGTGQPKFYPKSGDPVMCTRIVLELGPGNAKTRHALWAEGAEIQQAIAKAFRAAGREDIQEGDDLAVTFTGYDGQAKLFEAVYSAANAAP